MCRYQYAPLEGPHRSQFCQGILCPCVSCQRAAELLFASKGFGGRRHGGILPSVFVGVAFLCTSVRLRLLASRLRGPNGVVFCQWISLVRRHVGLR